MRLARFSPYAVTLLLVIGQVGVAQDIRQETSLAFVPADTAFFTTMLRNREQFDRLMNSRAVAKIKAMPVVQQGLAALRNEMSSGDLAQLVEFFQVPQNRELLDVLIDGVSDEVFVYGEARHGKWLGTLSRMSNTINMAQMRAELSGEDGDAAARDAMIALLDQDPDLLKVPATVIGFRMEDTAAVARQLTRLEILGKQLIASEAPQLEGRLSREKYGDWEYLTLKLDGTLVPWGELMSETDLDPDTASQLAQRLSQVTLTISLGIYRDYLILSFGENASQVENLGQGARLADQAELQRLVPYFERPVTGVGYVSDEFLQQVSNVDASFDQFRDMLTAVLPVLPIQEEIKTDLAADVEKFFAQAKKLQPKLGAVASVQYEVPGGFESVTYNWSEVKTLDASQPLSILRHLGGDPIGFYATRSKSLPEADAMADEWTPKLGEYFERIALPFMNSDQEKLYSVLKEKFLPLLSRLGKANRELLAPSTADGQSAIVLDAQQSAKQWHMAMPMGSEPVPLPELCCVWSVSDAGKLKQGAQEYFDVLQRAILELNEIMPDQVPPVELPPPQVTAVNAGQIYSYPIPPFLGLDPAVTPNAGLSSDTLVVSLVPKATERLLSESTLAASGPVAAWGEKPLGVAWQFKTHRFIQMIRPWSKYALEIAEREGESDPEIAAQIGTVLDVLECIRTCSGVGYLEDGVYVSIVRSEFQDLAE